MRKHYERRITKLETESRAAAHALKLQHIEYDRRLKDLNGEAGRIRTIQERFTTAEATSALDARVKILEGTQFRLAGQAENRTESKSQANFNWTQAVTIGGIVVLALIDLHSRGII